MPLVPWKPFRDLENFFEDWDDSENLLSRIPERRIPRIDIYEAGKSVIAEVEIPGMDPKDIDIEIKDNVLTVQGRVTEKKEENKKGYFRKEISRGFTKRSMPLPVEVEEKKARADYKDGLLSVVIPKAEPKKEGEKGTKVKVESKK